MNNQNNEQFEKFIRDMQNIRMNHDEKNKIRENLESFTYNYNSEMVKSPYQNIFTMFKKPLAIALGVFLLIGSTKPASASALPGQILYPIKMMHEDIEAATKNTSEKKAIFEIKRTETRIQEAIQLAKKEDLTAESQTKIAETIKSHTEKVVLEIKDIEKENPQKALALTSELKTTLKSNSDALKKVTSTNKKKKEKADADAEIVEQSAKEDIIKNLDEKEVYSSESDIDAVTPISEEVIVETVLNEVPLIEDVIISESDDEIIIEVLPTPEDLESEALVITEDEVIIEEDKFDIDILVQSLDLEIEITEIVEQSVKEDIIKNLDESVPAEETATEEESAENDITITETILETRTTEIIEDSIDQEFIAQEPVEETQEAVAEEGIIDTTDVAVEIMKEDQASQITYNKEGFRTSQEMIQDEITSLESIILLKNSLLEMAIETDMIVTPEQELSIDAQVQGFINRGQYGQALIYLQSEIDIITQTKQSQEIQEKLGIDINDIETTEEEILN